MRKLVHIAAAIAFVTSCATTALAAEREVAANFQISRFPNRTGDLQVSPDVIRRIVERTMEASGLRLRKVGVLPSAPFMQLQASTRYVPSAQNIRVSVFRPVVMVDGRKTCGMTGNSRGTEGSSGDRAERSPQQVIAPFVKNCDAAALQRDRK